MWKFWIVTHSLSPSLFSFQLPFSFFSYGALLFPWGGGVNQIYHNEISKQKRGKRENNQIKQYRVSEDVKIYESCNYEEIKVLEIRLLTDNFPLL